MIIYSERHLEHDREFHPENSQRLKSTMQLLTREDVFENVPLIEPKVAEDDDITRVHSQKHYELIKNTAEIGEATIDADTYVCPKSFEVAKLAAGGILTCVDKHFEGYKYSFALIRPPGHHAETSRAMGFCIFNNVAIGAKYAIEKYGLKRVLIFDYDVHHGNGTQEIFYQDPRVLYVSMHQHPFYPGTGRIEEVGLGEGEGFNINIPLPQGTCDKSYLNAFEKIVIPVIGEFKPQLTFISAGYDAHHRDPLGGMNLSSECYYIMSKKLEQVSSGIIYGLEGGYNIDALANSVFASLAALFDLEKKTEEPVRENARVTSYVDSRINAVRGMLAKYWKI